MRESRQSSVISQNDKLKYPKCEKKKQHSKQSLNFVCLTVGCKYRGLICVQCKNSIDHSGHNIQPLRTFLIRMEETLKKIEGQKELKIQQNESFKGHRNLLERLEETHVQILSTLKLQLEEISARIQTCEQEIINEYGRAREKISSEFEKQTLICKALEQIQSYLMDDKEKEAPPDLRLSVMKLLSLVKVQKSKFVKYQADVLIQNEAELQLNSYILAANSFKTNMLIWEKETIGIIGEVFKLKPEYQIKETKIRPTTAGEPTTKNAGISFSSQLKTDSIVLSSENKLAKVKDDKGGKVVLLTQKALDWKNTPVKFKISALSSASSLQLGACLKAQISQKLFKFQKSNLQHGFFVCSSNGFIYSNSDQSCNNTKWGLTFKTGDQITLQIDQKDNKISIKKKNDTKNYAISLKHLSQNDWKDLYLCACLNGKDDKVQILP